MELTTAIRYVPGIGPVISKLLSKLGIVTVYDLLTHTPFRYDDFSLITPINRIQEGETVTICGVITQSKNVVTKNGKKIQQVTITDQTDSITATWFNQPFLITTLKKDLTVSLSGTAKLFGFKLILQSPQYEILKNPDIRYTNPDPLTIIHTGRLVPVYPETRGITSKWLRNKINQLLHDPELLHEYLPSEIIEQEHFLSFNHALHTVHFPPNLKAVDDARNRLAFDELLFLLLQAKLHKQQWSKQTTALCIPHTDELAKWCNTLPFTLTSGQTNALEQIISDMGKPTPMNRLLQGDVGSGKTVIAAGAAYHAYLNNYSTVVMAPTEILAQQHFGAFQTFLKPYKLSLQLVTGSTTKTKKPADVLIGTHALLHREIKTKNPVGLIVIDEQHRFGVTQRALLTHKTTFGAHIPHTLTMTATPIPRTVALTLSAELDISTILTLPHGRKPVKTWVIPPHKRNDAYAWIIRNKYQTFIVCPFIEVSETATTVKAATVEYERLKKEVFPKLNVGLVHGKMKAMEKNTVIADFAACKLDILVATPVIEVGIDIPTASVMIIEGAQRFGLAQLHQLRGRVGRSDTQSFCLLFSDTNNANQQRLKALETIYDGRKLAELDLQLRGPGQLYGVSQHGIPQLRIADFGNGALIERASHWAQKLLEPSAGLDNAPLLRRLLKISTIEEITLN